MRSAESPTDSPTGSPTPQRIRGVEVSPLPTARRLAIAAERAGRRRSALHYLMTADVTAARRLMAMAPDTLSLTGFLTASVARAAAEHPLVHAYRDWRGRLVTHRHVDVVVPVETPTEQGPRVVPRVVADADRLDVAELCKQLASANAASPAPGIERLLDARPGLARVPGLLRAVFAAQDRSIRLRRRIGTVAVVSSGMSDVGEVFGIAAPALMPLQVMVGSICAAPHQTGNIIERHDILNLTLTFDHGVVDEREAAAFAKRLCGAIGSAEVLDSLLPGGMAWSRDQMRPPARL
jgi:pyruvate/2-oxoglutarate dehydrogenase complex dihydrolipoamide acyltransferase (E2) component